jgi:hypothetical protein
MGNSAICYSYGHLGHFKANCPRTQLQRRAAGVRAEATASGDKTQGALPEEEAKVVDRDWPQGEGEEPRYQEYPSDIPHEWDTEEASVLEWDDDFDNDTWTEYRINMILIGNKYYKRRHVFIDKHANDTPSVLGQEVEVTKGR